eukprot:1933828-Ditylum_brightwellii.AAC.1
MAESIELVSDNGLELGMTDGAELDNEDNMELGMADGTTLGSDDGMELGMINSKELGYEQDTWHDDRHTVAKHGLELSIEKFITDKEYCYLNPASQGRKVHNPEVRDSIGMV